MKRFLLSLVFCSPLLFSPTTSFSADLASESSETHLSFEQYGPVSSTETLWAISSKLRPNRSVSVQQTMVAIYKINPYAFYKSDLNKIIPESIIKVPSLEYVTQQTNKEAIELINKYSTKKNKTSNTAVVTSPVIDKPVTETPAVEPSVTEKSATQMLAEQLPVVEEVKIEEEVLPDVDPAVVAENEANKEKLLSAEKNLVELQLEMQLLTDQFYLAREATHQLETKLQPLNEEIDFLKQELANESVIQEKLQKVISDYKAQLAMVPVPANNGEGIINETLQLISSSLMYLLIAILSPVLLLLIIFIFILRKRGTQQAVENIETSFPANAENVDNTASTALKAAREEEKETLQTNESDRTQDEEVLIPQAESETVAIDTRVDEFLVTESINIIEEPASETELSNVAINTKSDDLLDTDSIGIIEEPALDSELSDVAINAEIDELLDTELIDIIEEPVSDTELNDGATDTEIEETAPDTKLSNVVIDTTIDEFIDTDSIDIIEETVPEMVLDAVVIDTSIDAVIDTNSIDKSEEPTPETELDTIVLESNDEDVITIPSFINDEELISDIELDESLIQNNVQEHIDLDSLRDDQDITHDVVFDELGNDNELHQFTSTKDDDEFTHSLDFTAVNDADNDINAFESIDLEGLVDNSEQIVSTTDNKLIESNELDFDLSGLDIESLALPTDSAVKPENDFIDIETLLEINNEKEAEEPYSELELDLGLEDFPDVVNLQKNVDIDDDENGVGAQLDLARAYLEIDDKVGAKGILEPLAQDCNGKQRAEIDKLLSRLK